MDVDRTHGLPNVPDKTAESMYIHINLQEDKVPQDIRIKTEDDSARRSIGLYGSQNTMDGRHLDKRV